MGFRLKPDCISPEPGTFLRFYGTLRANLTEQFPGANRLYYGERISEPGLTVTGLTSFTAGLHYLFSVANVIPD